MDSGNCINWKSNRENGTNMLGKGKNIGGHPKIFPQNISTKNFPPDNNFPYRTASTGTVIMEGL